jgi:hypothetical protein
MNTYDPSDHIHYVHLSGPAQARSPEAQVQVQANSETTCATLPSGYANQSPRTRLQRRQAHVRANGAGAASLTA